MATALIEAHGVSTHSRPKAAGAVNQPHDRLRQVSTHSRLKAAGFLYHALNRSLIVSTHSRLKAAGIPVCSQYVSVGSFNTQPPEGGWASTRKPGVYAEWFQHTAA